MIGNGCSGTEIGICGSGPQGTYYEWSYLIQTAFVSSSLKAKVNAACNWKDAALNIDGSLDAKCVSLLNQASEQIQNVNMYDIYGDCVNAASCSAGNDVSDKVGGLKANYAQEPRGKVPSRATYEAKDASTGEMHRMLSPRIVPHGPDACIDSKLASAYLNQKDVQKAIHVDITRNGQSCWSVCGSAPGWSYNSTRTNLPQVCCFFSSLFLLLCCLVSTFL